MITKALSDANYLREIKVLEIAINRCNSVESAKISITPNSLNIKYGPNGLGKSTIALAIEAAILGKPLDSMTPFKHKNDSSKEKPKVTGYEQFKSALIFDDKYIASFVFQKDEVLKNSFEIFIENEDYKTSLKEIETLLNDVKETFNDDEQLKITISDLSELAAAFDITKSGAISKASKGYKSLGSGNKLLNIPPHLHGYKDFLQSEIPSTWIAWQSKGNAFIEISHNCPYCSLDMQTPGKKDLAKQVALEYNSKTIEHLASLQLIIAKLGSYFEYNCKRELEKITHSSIELSPEQLNFLVSLKNDIVTLTTKLESLRNISFFSLKDVGKIGPEVAKLRIDIALISKLNSKDTQNIITPINNKLTALEEKIDLLSARIGQHKTKIAKTIQKYQDEINDFLEVAGYKYKVRIDSETNSYKMKIIHNDNDEHIDQAARHLSYGEKNAFALILFMYQCLKEKPDLVILDDPVSSFDKTKKFAILHELFSGKLSLQNSSVILLTHDLEPVIDILISVKRHFNNSKPTAHYLSAKSGIISEIEIAKEDIKSFSQICITNISETTCDIIKCIYARRYFEILDPKSSAYEILASLLHARPSASLKDGTPLTQNEINEGEQEIKQIIPKFDYNNIIDIMKNKSEMLIRYSTAKSGYEKLQLFRIYNEVHPTGKSPNPTIMKFVNESFHIENEYLLQLNPTKFDYIPEFIIQECDKLMQVELLSLNI